MLNLLRPKKVLAKPLTANICMHPVLPNYYDLMNFIFKFLYFSIQKIILYVCYGVHRAYPTIVTITDYILIPGVYTCFIIPTFDHA